MKVYECFGKKEFAYKKVVEKLLCYRLDMKPEMLVMHYHDELSDQDQKRIEEAYRQYDQEKKPLEYILGKVQFALLDFKVNEHTLIPRPETEYMIQAVDEYIKQQKSESDHKKILVDVGTGSGVLGLATWRYHKDFFDHIYLTELSDQALDVAQENFERLGGKQDSNIVFLQSDLLQGVIPLISQNDQILLVANLPYIPDETFDLSAEDNVKKREPRMAFVGGDDGLYLYRVMFDQCFQAGWKDVTMFLEMMTWQIDILRKEYGDRMDFEEVKTFHFNIRILKAVVK